MAFPTDTVRATGHLSGMALRAPGPGREAMRLQDKVALVTGGARGIGAGIARCLVEEGARAIGLAADASQAGEIAVALERAVGELGGLDVMVNNAGAGTGRENVLDLGDPGFENQSQEAWDAFLANNLRTTFAGSKAAIAHLRTRGGGSIVNIASIAGLGPSPGLPAYGAAKAGVIHLTRTLALELAGSDIRVNVICPGYLWTRAWEMLAARLKLLVPEFKDTGLRDIFLSRPRRTSAGSSPSSPATTPATSRARRSQSMEGSRSEADPPSGLKSRRRQALGRNGSWSLRGGEPPVSEQLSEGFGVAACRLGSLDEVRQDLGELHRLLDVEEVSGTLEDLDSASGHVTVCPPGSITARMVWTKACRFSGSARDA
jgi:NAD(P)-dependent dehydrogenase (short-subunit alcohol dehydrogenase family)